MRRIVAFCRSHHIDLRIVVTPAHAHQLEIMEATEGPTSVETKKHDLLRLVDEENTRYPHTPPTPIYDFSGFSSITEEAPPAPGTSTEFRYYWDSSHFKQLVGDFILDRVYGVFDAAHQVPADFGVQLSDVTIEPYLEDQRHRQANYRRRFPSDFARLRQLVSNALNNNRG
jgi:hypothetical protein